MMGQLSQFHFLRPEWFLVLLPIAIIYWLWNKQQAGFENWKSLLPDAFYPYLLTGKIKANQSNWMRHFIIFLLVLSILSLAGPTFQKREVPVFKAEKARIIMLDLSLSMLAEDMKPSRLERAKQKIQDILKQEQEGLTALVAYAGDAHLISPLTDDSETIKNLLPALEPLIMPQLGSRPDKAFELAKQTFKDNNIQKGDIVWITDGIEGYTQADTEKEISSSPHKVLIIGVGTTEGAPISLRGEYIKDRSGNIILPKLEKAPLQKMTSLMDVSYTDIRYDDLDIATLQSKNNDWQQSEEEQSADDQWQEMGHYLVWLALPFFALCFRRGYLMSIAAVFVLTPPPAHASFWDDLWYTKDQQGVQAMQYQDFEGASTKFETPSWKGSALYKQGQFEAAAAAYAEDKSALGDYNRGNALAKAGKIDEAIDAYQSALEKSPEHQDAKDNLTLLENLKNQQEQQQRQNGDNQDQEQNQDGESQDSENQQSQQGQNQEGQQQEQSEQQQGEQGEGQEQQNAQQGEQGEEQEQKAQQQSQQQESEQGEEESEEAQAQEQSKEGEESDEQTQMMQQQKEDDEQISAEKQMMQQWLRQIPDDPSGLLRRKLQRKSERESNRQEEPVLW